MAAFTQRHRANVAHCVCVAKAESREFDNASEVQALAPSFKLEKIVRKNRHSEWTPSVLAREWALGLTPLLRIDDVDANHEDAIQAAVYILACETDRQLSEQYPGVDKSDIYVVFGLTSQPVDRTISYYTAKYAKRMTWDGGMISAPGTGLEQQHENDLVIVASNYPVCGIESGDDSGKSAERCARCWWP
jgi:hypothetical protein